MTGKSARGGSKIAVLAIVAVLVAAGVFVYVNMSASLKVAAQTGQMKAEAQPEQSAAPESAPAAAVEAEAEAETETAQPPAPSQSESWAETPRGPRSLGAKDAPVVITEYASFTCSHCATFHTQTFDELRAAFVDTGKVRFVFNDFPLNKPAFDATMLARCLPPERYADFASLLFKTQESWMIDPDYLKHLRQNAKLAGLGEAQIDECLADTALQEQILAEMKAGETRFQINSTPSFVFNDGAARLTGAQPFDTFKGVIEQILAEGGAKTEPKQAE